jgi:hypothetical protein
VNNPSRTTFRPNNLDIKGIFAAFTEDILFESSKMLKSPSDWGERKLLLIKKPNLSIYPIPQIK